MCGGSIVCYVLSFVNHLAHAATGTGGCQSNEFNSMCWFVILELWPYTIRSKRSQTSKHFVLPVDLKK